MFSNKYTIYITYTHGPVYDVFRPTAPPHGAPIDFSSLPEPVVPSDRRILTLKALTYISTSQPQSRSQSNSNRLQTTGLDRRTMRSSALAQPFEVISPSVPWLRGSAIRTSNLDPAILHNIRVDLQSLKGSVGFHIPSTS